ncbi:MAG: hypothetical protein LH615_00655 [Ferruginibacter sp.]|nr:hypothetical protein [Ferruginibacter sp.]
MGIKNIFIYLLFFYSNCLHAQLNAEKLKDVILQDLNFSFTDSKQWKQIQSFYANNNFKPVWLNKENVENKIYLLDELKLSADLGLKENDYEVVLIEAVRKGTTQLQNITDSLKAEIQITAAALHFYNDIGFGNTTPALTYKGIVEMPLCYDIPILLAEYINNKTLPALKNYLTSGLAEISLLQTNIKWFNLLLGNKSFKEIIITSEKVTNNNGLLLQKLYQFGFI